MSMYENTEKKNLQKKTNNLQKVETKFEKNWPNSVVNYTGPAHSC